MIWWFNFGNYKYQYFIYCKPVYKVIVLSYVLIFLNEVDLIGCSSPVSKNEMYFCEEATLCLWWHHNFLITLVCWSWAAGGFFKFGMQPTPVSTLVDVRLVVLGLDLWPLISGPVLQCFLLLEDFRSPGGQVELKGKLEYTVKQTSTQDWTPCSALIGRLKAVMLDTWNLTGKFLVAES